MHNSVKTHPLVSIGMPIYNRPNELKISLKSILDSSYENIEVIVSDNCSPGTEVERVIKNFMKNDPRVKYFRQEENIGAVNNFKFVFEKSNGKYFMWASDDDFWSPDFIKNTTYYLESNIEYMAVSMEAQYFDKDKFDFFAEGKPFYDFFSLNKLTRLEYILDNNYGNLIYGLFRKTMLEKNNMVFDYNEIPFFLKVFEEGNWKVLKDVGLYKRTSESIYLQAKWEANGGVLLATQKSNFLVTTINSFKYHMLAYYDVNKQINNLSLKDKEKKYLQKKNFYNMIIHFFKLFFRYKKVKK